MFTAAPIALDADTRAVLKPRVRAAKAPQRAAVWDPDHRCSPQTGCRAGRSQQVRMQRHFRAPALALGSQRPLALHALVDPLDGRQGPVESARRVADLEGIWWTAPDRRCQVSTYP